MKFTIDEIITIFMTKDTSVEYSQLQKQFCMLENNFYNSLNEQQKSTYSELEKLHADLFDINLKDFVTFLVSNDYAVLKN